MTLQYALHVTEHTRIAFRVGASEVVRISSVLSADPPGKSPGRSPEDHHTNFRVPSYDYKLFLANELV